MLGYSYPLFLSPGCPFTVSSPHWRSLPSVTECSSALQLSSVLGGSWWRVPMCQASLPCVPYSLPSPEAWPQQGFRARGFIMHSALPKIMSFDCFQHFYPLHLFFFLLFLRNIKKNHTHTNIRRVQTCTKSIPAPDMGAEVHRNPSSTAGFWKVIQSFFFCHCTWRAGWLWCNAACAGVDQG